MINVFIVGSKGIPAKYGGFETFVENLIRRKTNEQIKYFVSCMGNKDTFEYKAATCFSISLRKDNAINRMLNVSDALSWIEQYLTSHPNEKRNLIYILGCRVGLLFFMHKKKLKKLGCHILVNPDGLEWKRDKWSSWQKKILLLSEKKLVKNSDCIVCDSKGIEKYILDKYPFSSSITRYIAYGSDVSKSTTSTEQLTEWLDQFSIKPNDYYLLIGRFVPENNYELIIREFMKAQTNKKLLIISNVEKNSFYQKLVDTLHFENDNRIVFAGTLYDEQLVKKIRENCVCYIHGHSVGGTNPSLLEALASSKINLLYDVVFNREVGDSQCLYFSDKEGNLSSQINQIEHDYKVLADRFDGKSIIEKRYSWSYIVEQYESLFLSFFSTKI